MNFSFVHHKARKLGPLMLCNLQSESEVKAAVQQISLAQQPEPRFTTS